MDSSIGFRQGVALGHAELSEDGAVPELDHCGDGGVPLQTLQESHPAEKTACVHFIAGGILRDDLHE
jgi:hypothetical protein